MFKPTKDQILQAWEDRDEGKPLSKEMLMYLEKLEQQEQVNRTASENADQAIKAALRAELRALEPEVQAEISRARARASDPTKLQFEITPGSMLEQYWKLVNKINSM